MSEPSIFHKIVADWLTKYDFVEVYKNTNVGTGEEYHFCKDGVRVECYTSPYESYCQMCINIFDKYPMEVRTMKYEVNTIHLESIYNQLLKYKNANL